MTHRVEKSSIHSITATFKNEIIGTDTTISWNKVGGKVGSDATVTKTETTTKYESKLTFNSVSEETMGTYWCAIVNMPGQMTDISTSLIEIRTMDFSSVSNALASPEIKGKFSAIINYMQWHPDAAEVSWDSPMTSQLAPIPQYYSGTFSESRSCVMKGWYESGTELESIEHVNTEDACREKCAAKSTCYSFLYKKTAEICTLMESVGGVTVETTYDKTFAKMSWCNDYVENIALDAEITSSSSSDLADINDGVAESTTGTLYTVPEPTEGNKKWWIKIMFKHIARVKEIYVFSKDADSVVGTHISIGQQYVTSITTAKVVYHWTTTASVIYDVGMLYLENYQAGATTGVNLQEIVIIGVYNSQQLQLIGELDEQSALLDGTLYKATVIETFQSISNVFKFGYINAKRTSNAYKDVQHSILHMSVPLECTFSSALLGEHWYPINFYSSSEEGAESEIRIKHNHNLCWTPEVTSSATYLSLDNDCRTNKKTRQFLKTAEGYVIHRATGLCLAPEDSAATISDSTNLILSKDCSAQFTLSSNHIRYENGTINGKKPYATNGETPKKGSRAVLVEACSQAKNCLFKYSKTTVNNVTSNFSREATTQADGSTLVTIQTVLYVRTQYIGYKWCTGYFNGTAVETNKVQLTRVKFDVPCVNDKISGKVGDIVTIFCNINAYDDFPTALLPEVTIASVPAAIALGNISMPEDFVPDTFPTQSVTFKVSRLWTDGYFSFTVEFPLKFEMSYKYLEVALNFSTFDFPGVLWTNPTLMIIDAVNQTELRTVGVVGLPATIKCYAVSAVELSELRLYFINTTSVSGKDEVQDYTYTATYDSAGDKTHFQIEVTDLQFSKEGDYYCSVKMSDGEWKRSESNSSIKVMGIINPPTNVTASVKGEDAFISCNASFPAIETIVPYNIEWFLVGNNESLSAGSRFDFTEVIDGNGLNRLVMSTIKIKGSPYVESFICKVNYTGFDITLSSTESLLVLLDVYLAYEVITAPLDSMDTVLRCIGVDVYYTEKVTWKKNGYSLASDYQKFVTYYDASIPATVAEMIFYDLSVSNIGNYTCEIEFIYGLKLSSDRAGNDRIRQTQINVIYVTDEMDKYNFATFDKSIKLTCMINAPLNFHPPDITWGLYYEPVVTERIQGFSTEAEGVHNEQVVVDGEVKYRSIFSTPELTLDVLHFRMVADFYNLTHNGQIHSRWTEIKYQYAALVMPQYGDGSPETNHFVLEGNNRSVTVKVFARTQLDTDHAVWQYMRQTDTEWQTVTENTTNMVQSLSTRTSDYTGGLIYATLTLIDAQREDDVMQIIFNVYFNDSTSMEIPNKPIIYVLHMKQYLLGYGFGRQNGIVKDVKAIFKTSDYNLVTYFTGLATKVVWYQCNSTALKHCKSITDEDGSCDDNSCSNDYDWNNVISSTTISLKLNVSQDNNGKVYYARISYPNLDIKPNSFTTHSIKIIMLGKCSDVRDLQWSQYPMSSYDLYDGTEGIDGSQIYDFGVKIDVGAMLSFYATARPQLSEIDSSTRIWLYCDQEFTPFIVITIEDLDTYVITKYSWNCTGEKVDGDTLYYDDKETVEVEKPEDGLVMLELQFLNQQIVIKAGYNQVKLNYADRTIYHKTDPIKIRQIEVKTGKHHVVFGALCKMQQGSKMDFSMTKKYHWGIPMIQWLNSWGVICSDSFHMSEAKVWCDKNMNQFQHGGMPDKGLGYKKEDTWLSGLNCIYDEVDSIYDCDNYGWANASCPVKDYAGVLCFTSGYDGITLRGTVEDGVGVVTDGELLIHYDRHWEGICSKELLTNDTATSMCIIMGLGKGVSYYGNTTRDFYWLDEIEAPGIVRTFDDIIHSDWGRPRVDSLNFCNKSSAIYLKCKPLLQCYDCEADNREHCMGTNVMQVLPKERSINLTSCNEDTDYCYRFVRETENGTLRASYGCMNSTPTYHETCRDMKRNLCLTGDKTCFCKQCVGSYCNHTPMFEAAYFTTLFQRGIGQNFLFSTRWLIYTIRIIMGDMTVISDLLNVGKDTDNSTTFS